MNEDLSQVRVAVLGAGPGRSAVTETAGVALPEAGSDPG